MQYRYRRQMSLFTIFPEAEKLVAHLVATSLQQSRDKALPEAGKKSGIAFGFN